MKALTVRQPWAWLLFHGKPMENRNWASEYRGQLAIHAAQGMTQDEYDDALAFVGAFDPDLAASVPDAIDLVRGAVIGTVRMTECVQTHSSPFFHGKFAFVFDNQQVFDSPVPARGALGLWDWEPGVK